MHRFFQPANCGDVVLYTRVEHDNLEDVRQTFEELPRITIPTKQGRREYVKAELLNSQNERRSWIQAHGYDIVDVKTKESYCMMSAECESGQNPYN